LNNPTKILIVGPSWVGDMIMAQSLFISLKNDCPDCLIDVLAPAWSLPLLERMPQIRKGMAIPLKHGQFCLPIRYQLGRELSTEGYDKAIVLPNSWKSALIPFFANIPIRTGFVGEWRWGLLNDVRKLDKTLLTMTVQRFLALGKQKDEMLNPVVAEPKLEVDKSAQENILHTFEVTLSSPVLALCPGAEFGPSKRWPETYFAEIANAKIADGWQVWLLGSEKDKAQSEQIQALTQRQCIDFTGKTALADAIDLLALANTVVTNDSGLMHIAAALNKKIIALYGSTPPALTPPLCNDAHILFQNLDCSPCRLRICPYDESSSPKHMACLKQITPDQVLDLIE
jgi:heptosyltransferase-2